MEALFIVPAMVSPQVNEKLIPALTKLIERNIILNNAALFKSAALEAFKGGYPHKMVKEGETPVFLLSDSLISENSLNMTNIGKLILEAKDKDYLGNLEKDIKKSRKQQNETMKKYNKELDNITDAINSINKPLNHKELLDLRKDVKDDIKLQDNLTKTSVGNEKSKAETEKIKAELKDRQLDIERSKYARGADDTIDRKSSFYTIDSVESPGDMHFFKQISMEPTILDIPIQIGRFRESNIEHIRIGVKCVPYIISSGASLVNLLNTAKNISWIERRFRLMIRKILVNIPLTQWKWINRGVYTDPDKAVKSVIFSKNRNELIKSTKLAKNFSSAESSSWSTMIILSSFDIEGDVDLVKFLSSYKRMTKYVIGDLIITNETKESAYFCTPRVNHCQEIPFEYLKKVLNLKDVLDYSEASRASAWKSQTNYKNASMKSAISESVDYKKVEEKVNDILKGF